MTTTTKQKDGKKVPKLRFSGFDGEWEKKRLGQVLSESRIKGGNGLTAKKLTIKLWGKGVYAKEIQGSPNTNYYIRKAGQFIYSKLDFLNCAFGIIPEHLDGYESTLDLPTLDIDNAYNSKFLLERIKQRNFYIKYGETADGSRKARRIHVNVLLSFPISLPTLPEQQKIANFLEAVDKWIENLRSQKESLEAYKKGMMQKVFPGKGEKVPEVRFEGFSGEWEEKRLGEICSLIKDGTHGTHPNTLGGGYRLLSAKNIKNGKVRIDASDREISVGEYEKIHSSYELHSNDILLSIVGTIGNVALFDGRKNIAFQRSVAFFRLQKDLPGFVYYIFVSHYFQNALKRRQVVSAQPGIYLGDLAQIPIFLPTLPEQQKIADFLSSIDKLIEAKQEQICKTEDWKKGLMQGLFI